MGATPIWNLAIGMTQMQSQMLTLTVNTPINLHCTHTKSQTKTLTQTLTVNGPLQWREFLNIRQPM